MEIPTTTLAIFAVVAAMGLVGVVAIGIMSVPLDAEAKGCANPNAPGGGSIAFNASKGRCLQ
ncbi:MAG: hypothetical protein M3530_06610 [Thermoproteota archaeon]|nr:hypothetical protein [Thermoproteota archaeon]